MYVGPERVGTQYPDFDRVERPSDHEGGVVILRSRRPSAIWCQIVSYIEPVIDDDGRLLRQAAMS